MEIQPYSGPSETRAANSVRPEHPPLSENLSDAPAGHWPLPPSDAIALRTEPDSPIRTLERQMRGIVNRADIGSWNIDSFPRTIASHPDRRFGTGDALEVEFPTRKYQAGRVKQSIDKLTYFSEKHPKIAKFVLGATQLTSREKMKLSDVPAAGKRIIQSITDGTALAPLDASRPAAPVPESLEEIMTPTRSTGRFTRIGAIRVATKHLADLRALVEAWHDTDPAGARMQMHALRNARERTEIIFDDPKHRWAAGTAAFDGLGRRIYASTKHGIFEPIQPRIGTVFANMLEYNPQVGGTLLPRHLAFAHEVQHRLTPQSVWTVLDHMGKKNRERFQDYHDANEVLAISYENELSKRSGLIPRSSHLGVYVPMPDLQNHRVQLPVERDGSRTLVRPGETISGRLAAVDKKTVTLHEASGAKVRIATTDLLDAVRPHLGLPMPMANTPSLHEKPMESKNTGRGLRITATQPDALDQKQLSRWRRAVKDGDSLDITVMPDYGVRTDVLTQPPVQAKLTATDDGVALHLATGPEFLGLRTWPLVDGGIRVVRRQNVQ